MNSKKVKNENKFYTINKKKIQKHILPKIHQSIGMTKIQGI